MSKDNHPPTDKRFVIQGPDLSPACGPFSIWDACGGSTWNGHCFTDDPVVTGINSESRAKFAVEKLEQIVAMADRAGRPDPKKVNLSLTHEQATAISESMITHRHTLGVISRSPLSSDHLKATARLQDVRLDEVAAMIRGQREDDE